MSLLPANSANASTADPNTKIPINYMKNIDAVIKIEPKTGFIIETEKHHEDYFINTAKYGMKPNPKIFEINYSTPREDMMDAVDNAAKNYGALDMITTWIPPPFCSPESC